MAGGTCAQSHEIGCLRRDEIQYPRSHEVTHQLRGIEVPSEHICQIAVEPMVDISEETNLDGVGQRFVA